MELNQIKGPIEVTFRGSAETMRGLEIVNIVDREVHVKIPRQATITLDQQIGLSARVKGVTYLLSRNVIRSVKKGGKPISF